MKLTKIEQIKLDSFLKQLDDAKRLPLTSEQQENIKNLEETVNILVKSNRKNVEMLTEKDINNIVFNKEVIYGSN